MRALLDASGNMYLILRKPTLNMAFFSVIIPIKNLNEYVAENVVALLEQSFSDWELIIVTNEPTDNPWRDSRITLLHSGKVAPGRKRDLGSMHAVGKVLVFLDDDSYPPPDYLRSAYDLFINRSVKAVGGPGITPVSDGFWAQVSGAVFVSGLSGGNPARYLKLDDSSGKIYKDWPSVNLLVERDTFLAVGGFDCDFWPGEDTHLCRKMWDLAGIGVEYQPGLAVEHHRRGSFLAHVHQVAQYGRVRGYFLRSIGVEVEDLKYLIPSVFFLFHCSVPLLLYAEGYSVIVSAYGAYLLVVSAALVQISKRVGVLKAGASIPYIFATHFAYGFFFIKGILSKAVDPVLR